MSWRPRDDKPIGRRTPASSPRGGRPAPKMPMVASILTPGPRPVRMPATTKRFKISARAGRSFGPRRGEFVGPKRHGIKDHMRIGQCRRLKKETAPSDVTAQTRREIGHSGALTGIGELGGHKRYIGSKKNRLSFAGEKMCKHSCGWFTAALHR